MSRCSGVMVLQSLIKAARSFVKTLDLIAQLYHINFRPSTTDVSLLTQLHFSLGISEQDKTAVF